VDPCQGVNCPDGQYCKEGKCIPWPGNPNDPNEGEDWRASWEGALESGSAVRVVRVKGLQLFVEPWAEGEN